MDKPDTRNNQFGAQSDKGQSNLDENKKVENDNYDNINQSSPL